MGYFVSTLRNKAANQRPTFIAAYTRYGILYLSFIMDTSAAYNDEQRRVPFLIKNQSPTLTVRINLIGLTAGGEGSCKTLTGVDTSRLELTCRSLSR